MAEHGGNLDNAINAYGGARSDWIDLSTGINPHAYPIPAIAQQCWTDLPDEAAVLKLIDVAGKCYHTNLPILPMAGAQQAIQTYPAMMSKGRAGILSPTYNEHAIQLKRHGWDVFAATSIEALCGYDLAVIVNPNNPDGQEFTQSDLLALAKQVGLLVVDESFVDSNPQLSLCPHVTDADDNILILRSFGKFYGLAGLRLGFAIGAEALLDRLAAQQGSWAVSGPALAIGAQALADTIWANTMRDQLSTDAIRLDNLAINADWHVKGGTSLFRLFEVEDAASWQEMLARHHIWSRRFSYAPNWIRLGLPPTGGWSRLEKALKG